MPVKLKVFSNKKAFAEVAGDALFRIADGGEVDFLVPSKQKLEIDKKLFALRWSEVQAKGFEELIQTFLIDHGGIVGSSGLPRKFRREAATGFRGCFTWNIPNFPQ